MKSYNIHFIRHGEIEETKNGAYIGVSDVSLSEKGKQDLIELDKNNRYPYAPVLFSSPLKRCLQTCEIIYPGKEPIVVDELSEINFGLWEGKTAEELKDNLTFNKWLSGDNSVKPPEGESSADFTRRVCLMFQKIVDGLISTGHTEAVIVTHGGVIMTLMAVYGLPQAKPFEWACESGCGYSIRVTPMLWQRDRVSEVYRLIPEAIED
ncbi:MAG: histidine phosphatase family protein [Clostridia bacterium]|nr:histidine phosphatase family protein [Clostridia bacterium]